eukprot:gene19866-23765_t
MAEDVLNKLLRHSFGEHDVLVGGGPPGHVYCWETMHSTGELEELTGLA